MTPLREHQRLHRLYTQATTLHTRLWLRYDEMWLRDDPNLPRLRRIADRAERRWKRRLLAAKGRPHAATGSR